MAGFEDSIMSHLKAGGLAKDHLSSLTAAAAQINASGIKGMSILTKGTPVPDWIRMSGIADKAAISKLVSDVLGKQQQIGNIQIFPYGIPFPDIYRVEIDIGPGAQHG